MAVVDLNQMTIEELAEELHAGSRFIVYKYCISIVILTFQNPSGVHLVRAEQNRFLHGLPYTLLSLVAGWWGFPWGPIYTIGSIGSNIGGGTDITAKIRASVNSEIRRLSGRMETQFPDGDGDVISEMPKIKTR